MAKKGSTKAKCQAYKSANIRERNKKRRLVRHLKTNENDKDALNALKNVA